MSEKNSAANCVVCGGVTRTLRDPQLKRPTPVHYDVCDRCGFIRKQAAFHLEAADEKASYDLHHNGFDSPGYVAMFERFIAEAINPFITEGKGLDFGSGPGPVLHHLLQKKGFKMRHYDPYYHPNKDALDAHYDLITTTEVLEHLSDPVGTIDTVLARLNPGGILAIQTLFHPRDDTAFLDWWYRRDDTHIGFFTPKTFEKIVEKHAAKIIYTNDKNIVVIQKEKRERHETIHP